MLRKEWTVKGKNGTDIYMREWTSGKTGEALEAVVCIVHGMGEHGERYRHVAAEFAESGIATLALDQQGHGRSAGKRGHLPLDNALSDALLLLEEAGKRYPGLPLFLYGHSMGGNVALNCALRRLPAISGLIVTSPWLRLAFAPPRAVEWVGRKLTRIVPALHQRTGLKPEQLYRVGYEQAALMEGDELCHTYVTLQTYVDFTASGLWAIEHGSSLRVPLLLMHGTEDRISSPEASGELAKRLGERCSWVAWPGGYHELHNDIEGNKVIMDIKKWIKQQL